MELAIYFANCAQLDDLDEALRDVDTSDIPSYVSTIIFGGDTSSREYYGNLIALKWLAGFTEATGVAFSRLYFGQEFCQHLIPDPEEVLQAYYQARQLGWQFTYTTGACTDEALARQMRNLAALAEQDDEIEVVVNDWGVLHLLRRHFPSLIPVQGRLLHKQMRLSRFTTYKSPPPVNMNGLATPEEDIRRYQLAAVRDTSLADPEYRQDLRDLGFVRVDVDMAPQGLNFPAQPDGLGTSAYYPWGYAAGGRNCLTASVLDPVREYVVVDGPCPRPCQRFNKCMIKLHGDETLIQRGNSVFAFHMEYAAPDCVRAVHSHLAAERAMRITVGIDRADTPETIAALHQAGANEFFAGLVPPSWSEHYGWEISPNRRGLGGAYQYTSPDELGGVIACARDLGCPVFIALNAHSYGPGQLRLLGELVAASEALDPAGYIVADPALLVQLAAWGVRRPVNLSTGAACYNAEHVRWLAELMPLRRVVLPRKLALGEVARLVADLADLNLEFEAMVTGYRCFFNDEFCFSWHSGMAGMFCADFVHSRYAVSRRLSPGWKEQFAAILDHPTDQFAPDSELDQLVRAVELPPCPLDAPAAADRGGGMHRELARSYWQHCGLCAIPALRQAGVQVLKSPARGESWRKLRDVAVLRQVADQPDPDRDFCRALVGSDGFCADPANCYYALPEERPWN